MECLNIFIRGTVQGVGFRPFIYNLANELSLKGYVTNTSEGVSILVEGNGLDIFLERIRTEAPPLSKITSVEISPESLKNYTEFSIKESTDVGSFTLISPDISVCEHCLHELFDMRDRRYLYPFINCTNCGPRYSITRSVPYDRMNTTMNMFQMCAECESEYRDPADRRFHAQPNACPQCGPHVELIRGKQEGRRDEGVTPILQTIELLKQGSIIAIKGLGGFHIACDATNPDAVIKLRERKRRNHKPFALMAPDIAHVKKYCHVLQKEEELLTSVKRPVVLFRKRDDSSLSEAIAFNNEYLGFMLPYTPLHYLLFYAPLGSDSAVSVPHFSALVMTSGNLTEEPIVIDNRESETKLSGIADDFLIHNRDIFMRVDDSVVRVRGMKRETKTEDTSPWYSDHGPKIFYIRRSRGYVPDPIPLFDDGPDVLGCGADLKNTFTLTKGRYAIPSQHIGDMENFETLVFFEEILRNLKSVYRSSPEVIAYDLHPHYMSTRWALRQGLKTYGVQHHYAHIASVMAEKCIKEKVIGVSFDGNGYGEDGTLWGGEFLVADSTTFRRGGHLFPVPLPGGEAAIREPWRTSVSYVKEATGDEVLRYIEPTGYLQKYGQGSVENVLTVRENDQFSPLSSGAGRLFDAVSALLGICDINTFEGEAAMALESLVLKDVIEDYPIDIRFKDPIEIDFSSTILCILDDMRKRTDRRLIATKFHNTVCSAIIRVVAKLSLVNNLYTVVLSGGVFQNAYLLDAVMNNLVSEGLVVHVNEAVPSNDAGISLGQAFIIRERMKAGLL